MTKLFHRIALFLVLTLAFHFIYGQDQPMLIFTGKVTDVSGKKLDGVQVVVKQDNKPFETKTTGSNGKYDIIEAPFGHIYTLVFKKDGMVSKTLVLDTKKGYFEEDVEPRTFIEPSISLINRDDEVDYDIIENQPVGKARIDPQSGKLDWDYAFSGQRKSEIDRYLKQLEQAARQKEAQFKKMVNEGNAAYNKEDYELAILKYEEAISIKADETISAKIASAKKNLALKQSQKEQQNQYDALINKGNDALSSNNFDGATDFYTQAKDLLPGNQIAYDKLREVEQKKQDLADAEINAQFKAKMELANTAFEKKEWENAKKLYKEASSIKPNDRSPKDRIIEIDNLLSKMKSDDEDYAKFTSKGDQLLAEKNFDDAISNYQKASNIKPEEVYPKEQIEKAKQEKQQAEDQAELDRQYANLVKTADHQLKNLSYENAKTTYNEALKLKSDESYPKDQIAAIDQKLQDIQAENDRLNKQQKDYDDQIVIADKLFNEEKWQESTEAYKKAQEIKPDEVYPKQRIDDINMKLQHLAAVENEKRKRYDESIQKGDAAFSENNWKLAKQYYSDALTVFDDEKHPLDQIALIETKLQEEEQAKLAENQKNQQFDAFLQEGDLLLEEQNFLSAKSKYLEAKSLFPDRSIVDQKLQHLNTLYDQYLSKQRKDSVYNALITSADGLFTAKDWSNAEKKYHDALEIKPLEDYPKNQLELIANSLKDEAQQSINSQYDELIKKGDDNLSQKSYKEALDYFDQANEILPNESYPLDKIREIKRILSDEEEKENNYKMLINQGDNQFESENWDKALVSYESAKAIFDRDYPNNQITKINTKLAELRDQQGKDAQNRASYDNLIKEADQLFLEEKYQESKDKFNEALSLFKDEYYPKKKIFEIDAKLKDLNLEKETVEKYNQLITNADQLRDNKKWVEAKKIYGNAFNLMPEKEYPQEQINFINEQMKLETQQEFQVQYDKLIKAADDQFNTKEYNKAKELYTRARNMNAEDNYPSQKITEIDQILLEMASNKLDEERFKANKEKYDQLISKANGLRDAEQWEKSKELYIQANKVLPSETFPQEQITFINQKMKESAAGEIEKQYNKVIDMADKLFQDEKYEKSLNLYRRAQSLKPDDAYPPEQIKKVEEAKMIAFNKEKRQQEFGLLIKEGKRAFEIGNYRLALRKFNESLKINKEAKFPIQKIKEINDILDKQKSNNKKNDDVAVNPGDFRTLYGEEVTGKYSEDQIDALMLQGHIDDKDDLTLDAELQKDQRDNFSVKNREQQNELTFLQNQQVQSILTKIDRSFDNSDDPRWKIIPQVEQYKDQRSFYANETSSFSADKTYRTDENFNRLQTNDANLSLIRDENISLQNSSFVNYMDEKLVLDRDMIQRGNSITYDNSLSKEMIYTDFDLANLNRRSNQDQLIDALENFKGSNALMYETNNAHFENTTYSNYDNTEAVITKYVENFSLSDDKRIQQTLPAFVNYKDDYLTTSAIAANEGVDVTYAQYDGTQQLKTALNNFALNADIPREENAFNVDHYLDKESQKLSVWGDKSQDKVYNMHLVHEMIDDEQENQFANKESLRNINVSELDNYNDRMMMQKSDLADYDKKGDYMNSQRLDEMKSKTALSNTDINTQKLALEYPEGITEKMFQRTNSRGDIIEVTILRIVVRGNKGDEYKKVKSKWGVSFFKNGGITTEYIWDTETN